MTTRAIKMETLPAMLYEIGEAIELNKISIKDVTKLIPLKNVKALADKIDDSEKNWDDSHITKGGLLRASLEAHEISQAELAKILNVKPQKINDLISGRLNFTVAWAKKISAVLNVSYKVFI
jgi:DNA-binding XRE family transcriptional regulator